MAASQLSLLAQQPGVAYPVVPSRHCTCGPVLSSAWLAPAANRCPASVPSQPNPCRLSACQPILRILLHAGWHTVNAGVAVARAVEVQANGCAALGHARPGRRQAAQTQYDEAPPHGLAQRHALKRAITILVLST